MSINRRGLGLICIGIGALALISFVWSGAGRGNFLGGGRAGDPRAAGGRQQPAAAAAQPAPAQQPAASASADYLRGYADGLEAKNAQQIAPQSAIQDQGGRQERIGGRGGRGDHHSPIWAGLLALPVIMLGVLLFARNRGGRWPWNRGGGQPGRRSNAGRERDAERPLPARPEAETPPYTGETHRF